MSPGEQILGGGLEPLGPHEVVAYDCWVSRRMFEARLIVEAFQSLLLCNVTDMVEASTH